MVGRRAVTIFSMCHTKGGAVHPEVGLGPTRRSGQSREGRESGVEEEGPVGWGREEEA
jgi:hypothetical protein